jgi:hypothetical protein
LAKASASGLSDWELADKLEQTARELRGNTGFLVCPETNARLRAVKIRQPTPKLSLGTTVAPVHGTKIHRIEINIPVTREGDQRQRAFLSLLVQSGKWTDLDIALLTEIAFGKEIHPEHVRAVRRPTTRRARILTGCDAATPISRLLLSFLIISWQPRSTGDFTDIFYLEAQR